MFSRLLSPLPSYSPFRPNLNIILSIGDELW